MYQVKEVPITNQVGNKRKKALKERRNEKG